jgi:hypothetical protein
MDSWSWADTPASDEVLGQIRLKQDPRWKAEQLTPALIRWTTPTGRQHTTEPTRHPI